MIPETLEDWCVAHHAEHLRRTGQIQDGPGLPEPVSVPAPEPEIPVFVPTPIAPDLSAVQQQIVDDTTGRP